LGELGMAAIYAVAALYVLDAYFPPREPEAAKLQESRAAEAEMN
jgi:hypothetical protein